MKFYTYLNEVNRYPEEYSNILHVLTKKNTKPFLKEFGKMYGSNKFIYRGYGQGRKIGYLLKKTRTDRKPRYLNQDLHEHLSKLSKDLWGWDMRKEGVFTGDSNNANHYGSLWKFIPIGNYKYVYTPDNLEIYSLYDLYVETPIEDERENIRNQLDELYKTKYMTKGLSNLLSSKSDFEAIFKCDEYILTRHPQLYKIIVNAMKYYKLI